ncbi:MAG: exodeoxyribonuclease V subunit alpha [Pseudomonadota bacterium]|nr:exodeoxyribonuclease V subunit alpha [Pseudomonadota bacterium]
MTRRISRSRRVADTTTGSLFAEPELESAATLSELASALAPEPLSTPGQERSAAPQGIDAGQAALAEGFANHVVRWMEQSGAPTSGVGLVRNAAWHLSIATASGHACIRLRDVAASDSEVHALREALITSRVVGSAEAPGSAPLVLDHDGRLYLHRYFDYERRIARRLMRCRERDLDASSETRLAARLTALFISDAPLLGATTDWQKVAAALAVLNSLTVISGGPGTGKTTTVVNMLACVLDLEPECRIALTAPTGKAAARMQEAVRQRAVHLSEDMQQRLPTESFTIHRLLGFAPGNVDFLHHAGNPLPYDVVVVDEASMLDLALAAKLFDAIAESARIILLGDKDQLAAVESGAVFSELSAGPALSTACKQRLARVCHLPAAAINPPPARDASPLRDSVIWFTHNFRFGADSAIGRLASGINAGDPELVLDTLRAAGDSSATWLDSGAPSLEADAVTHLVAGYAAYIDAVAANARDHKAAFEAFDGYRILCAQREGPRGVRALNDVLGKYCRAAMDLAWPAPARSAWYVGRPIMVLRNDYVLKLYNGDVGIALPDAAGDVQVYFRGGDGSFRCVAPLRLPEHETAFATTVHKAQGSEFDAIALVLPINAGPVLTREMLYTAVTRAKRKIQLFASADVLRTCILSPTRRHSGLVARLAESA